MAVIRNWQHTLALEMVGSIVASIRKSLASDWQPSEDLVQRA